MKFVVVGCDVYFGWQNIKTNVVAILVSQYHLDLQNKKCSLWKKKEEPLMVEERKLLTSAFEQLAPPCGYKGNSSYVN